MPDCARFNSPVEVRTCKSPGYAEETNLCMFGTRPSLGRFRTLRKHSRRSALHPRKHILSLRSRLVLLAPRPHGLDDWAQALSRLRKGVFNPRRYLRVHTARHQTSVFHVAQLRGYQEAGIDLVLTSHYTPEDLKDVQTKIDYLEDLKAIAAQSADAASFKAAVQQRFPEYAGENYLDMTCGFFFAE